MSQLADFYVQLSTRGYATTQQEIDAIKQALEDSESPATKLRKRMEDLEAPAKAAAAQTAALTAALGGVAAVALAAVGSVVALGVSMVKAGLAGSAEMDRWDATMNKLNRRMAGMFLPVLEKAGGALDRFITSQDQSFSRLGDALEKMATVLLPIFESKLEVIGRLLEKVVVPCFEAMAAALEKANKTGVLQAWDKMFNGPMDSLAFVAGQIETMAGGGPGPAKPARQPTMRAGGFEGLTDTYRRVAQQAIAVSKDSKEDIPKQQRDLLQEAVALLGQLKDKLNKLNPFVSK